MAPISVNQLHSFYNLDRVLFNHLITKLSRNPAQSLLVMALWIWLEKLGYPSIIPVLTGLCDALINAMFNEADTCLRWLQLENVPIPNDGGLPLTRIAMHMEISLELFIRRRFTAIAGIKNVLNTVCARIFIDILQKNFGITNNTSTSARISGNTRTRARARTSTRTNAKSKTIPRASVGASPITGTSLHFPDIPLIIPGFPHPLFGTRDSARVSTNASTSAGIGSTSTSLPRPVTPLVIPGFPHPLFGNFTVPPINFEEMDLFDSRIWANTGPHDDITDDDKTMFLTFSKGFPVTEDEVRHLFTSSYGDCIKVLNMGEMREQVLFATMVLNKVEQLDMILNGKFIAKLRVNGKHIWARKYERRD
ncbi:uncharacterized protein LOC130710198 [Lotus japonicus]|uniref:uncharacterized protein LOC130710198 n=1 Tax=Lotus japonicus TaxID=34305 RepID=UPI002582C0D0|nr:uncharacterized protein LOC130710198 [Lotus japonicus]